jgi:hypothetical protein
MRAARLLSSRPLIPQFHAQVNFRMFVILVSRAATDNLTRQRYDNGHGDRLMAANIEEKVIEKLRRLPEDQQAEVLKFVEDLAGVGTNADNGRQGDRGAIWDKIEEIMRDVPEEVLATIPADGSINVDHYLYGTPKKQT